MRASVILGSAAVLLSLVAAVRAAELKSGLQPGDLVGAFDVEKVGGAVNDGKETGANFCYRCMLGQKPVVMVFSRSADKELANLVKELEKQISKNADQKLSSFVNLIGDKPDALKAAGKEFANKYQVENVALVVPHENDNGPSEFNINPAVDVTVTIYRNGKVEASHAVAEGQLNQKEIEAIIADTGKILK
jgi:hypothetical protein